jgi:ATP/maltotriose-dependent transcriptional regulator MalT
MNRHVSGDSVSVLDYVTTACAQGKHGLTHDEMVEVRAALDDIAVHVEQMTDAVTQLLLSRKSQASLKNVALTEREREILGYLAAGKSNGEIAACCQVSKNTVKFHVKNLFGKLGVRNRSQAMMVAKSVNQMVSVSPCNDDSLSNENKRETPLVSAA